MGFIVFFLHQPFETKNKIKCVFDLLTDDAVCIKLGESMRYVCYQNSVYSRCKQTCKKLVLADNGNKKYKDLRK